MRENFEVRITQWIPREKSILLGEHTLATTSLMTLHRCAGAGTRRIEQKYGKLFFNRPGKCLLRRFLPTAVGNDWLSAEMQQKSSGIDSVVRRTCCDKQRWWFVIASNDIVTSAWNPRCRIITESMTSLIIGYIQVRKFSVALSEQQSLCIESYDVYHESITELTLRAPAKPTQSAVHPWLWMKLFSVTGRFVLRKKKKQQIDDATTFQLAMLLSDDR